MTTDFNKYALSEHRLSSLSLDMYARSSMAYMNPTIIEERQLNAVAMDVFSRLMMDRIIFPPRFPYNIGYRDNVLCVHNESVTLNIFVQHLYNNAVRDCSKTGPLYRVNVKSRL